MIIELSTNFSDTEKNLLKQWADVDIKLYIDVNKIIDSSYVFKKENNVVVVTDKPIEIKASEMPGMMPNRIICVDYFYWLVEQKDEPGSWYAGLRGKNGAIICYDKYDDLETAFHDYMNRMRKDNFNITHVTREYLDEIENQMIGRYPYHYFIIHDVDVNKKYSECYFRNRNLYDKGRSNGVRVSDNIFGQWSPEINILKTLTYDRKLAYDSDTLGFIELEGLLDISSTIIPHSSLSDFKSILRDTLWKCSEPDKTKFGSSGFVPQRNYLEMAIDVYVTETLIKLVEQAQAENKFIIHFGI